VERDPEALPPSRAVQRVEIGLIHRTAPIDAVEVERGRSSVAARTPRAARIEPRIERDVVGHELTEERVGGRDRFVCLLGPIETILGELGDRLQVLPSTPWTGSPRPQSRQAPVYSGRPFAACELRTRPHNTSLVFSAPSGKSRTP